MLGEEEVEKENASNTRRRPARSAKTAAKAKVTRGTKRAKIGK